MRLALKLVLIFAFALLTSLGNAAYPEHRGYVNDYANLLSVDQKNAMEHTLDQNFRNGGWAVAVVTVPDMDGQDVETYAHGLFNTWGIGRADKNDGALILLSLNPRKIRIEVGRGIEGDLTDIYCARLIRDQIVPHLKSGDIYQGLVNGAQGVIEAKPRELSPAEREAIAARERVEAVERAERAKVEAKERKERQLEQMMAKLERERQEKTEALQSAEKWKHIKSNILYVSLFLLALSPIWGPALFLFIRKYLREKAIRDEEARILKAEEDRKEAEHQKKLEAARKERERLARIAAAEEAARQRERERIAYEKEQAWRKANPEAAREKDRKEKERREREEAAERERRRLAAIAAAAALAARRKREADDEEDRRRRNRNSGSGFGGFGGGSSGGFGGGRSSGGGASSSW